MSGCGHCMNGISDIQPTYRWIVADEGGNKTKADYSDADAWYGGSSLKFSVHVVDATCPLVGKVHREVLRFVREGYEIVYIGHKGHDEAGSWFCVPFVQPSSCNGRADTNQPKQGKDRNRGTSAHPHADSTPGRQAWP